MEIKDNILEEFRKAAANVGITPDELLEAFINDIGIMQCDAWNWYKNKNFEEAGYEIKENTFTQYLYSRKDSWFESAEQFLETYREMIETENVIKEFKDNVVNPDFDYAQFYSSDGRQRYESLEQYREYANKEIVEQEKNLKFYRDAVMHAWNEYVASSDCEDLSLEAEVQKLEEWLDTF